MPAAITDKFREATNGSRPDPTTITVQKGIGAASITCGALTGWPTATAVDFMLYQKDASGNKVAGTQTDWIGIVSGSNINSLTLKAGTDQVYPIGSVVEAGPTAAWGDDMAQGIVVEHSQDGTHKANFLTASMLSSTLQQGWQAGSGTWTYASATTFTVPAADAALMSVGTKIWFTQTTSKYFYVTGVSGTTITVTGGSDYTVANAVITAPYFSNATTPFGFPGAFNYVPAFTGTTSGANTGVFQFSVQGRLCTVFHRNTALLTSNATTFTTTAPITSANPGATQWEALSPNSIDNSATLTTPSSLYIANNTTTINMFKTAGLTGAWTAAGGKACDFTLTYFI